MKHQSENLLGLLGIGRGDVSQEKLRKTGESFVSLGAQALQMGQCPLKAAWSSNHCQRETKLDPSERL